MALIGKDSCLRRLPTKMDARQARFFDAIRYSVEMADIAHERLRSTLTEISKAEDADRGRLFATALLDAWAIIDSLHRLRLVLNQTPRLEKAPYVKAFLKRLQSVEDLRHHVQHLQERLRGLVRAEDDVLPAWGHLLWLEPWTERPGGVCVQIMAAGAVRSGVSPAIDTWDLERPTEPIGWVDLALDDKIRVRLTRLMDAVAAFVPELEASLTAAIRSQGGEQGTSDLLVRMKLAPGEATPKEGLRDGIS